MVLAAEVQAVVEVEAVEATPAQEAVLDLLKNETPEGKKAIVRLHPEDSIELF